MQLQEEKHNANKLNKPPYILRYKTPQFKERLQEMKKGILKEVSTSRSNT